jgi:hypothetical protein
LLLVLGRERRPSLALAAMLGFVLLMLHLPALCTLAVRAAGSPWMLRRIDIVMSVSSLVIVPGVFARLMLDRGWLRGPAVQVAFALSLAYAWQTGIDAKAWTRAKYHARVEQPDKQEIELRKQARRASLLSNVQRGAVIATPVGRAVELPKLCDCFGLALASHEASHGMSDMADRRYALPQILHPGVDNVTRAALMRRFGVRYIFVGISRRSTALRKAVAPLTLQVHRTKAGMLIELDPHRPLPP